VKLSARLLLILPFIVVTILYLRLNLASNGCWGLIEVIYSFILWVLLAATFTLAIVATLRKRQSQKLKAEPATLTVIIITLLVLIAGMFFSEIFKGAKWIDAKSENYNAKPSSVDLTLRKNGSFTVYLKEADFSCYYSGKYKKSGDTIILDKEVIDKTDFKLATHYLLNEKYLTPIVD
jgi:hypothetical protein